MLGIRTSETSSHGHRPIGRRTLPPRRNTWRWIPTVPKSETDLERGSALFGRNTFRNSSPLLVSNFYFLLALLTVKNNAGVAAARYFLTKDSNLYRNLSNVFLVRANYLNDRFIVQRSTLRLHLDYLLWHLLSGKYVSLTSRRPFGTVESKSIGSITFSGREILIERSVTELRMQVVLDWTSGATKHS